METLLRLDGDILLWIQENMRTDLMTTIMRGITRLGDNGCMWIALAVVLLVIGKTRRVGAASALSLLLTFMVVNLGIKNIVERVRPYEVIEGLTRLVPAEESFSFPSGHSAHAFAVGVVIFLMLPRKVGIPVLVLGFLIAFSRMYVGVHYPTDVLAGIVIGSLLAYISVRVVNFVMEKWERRNKRIQAEEDR